MTAGGKGPDIKWEDDDSGFEDATAAAEVEQEVGGGDEFAALLEDAPEQTYLMIGEKVKGLISRVGPSGDVMVDLGSKMSGVVERGEMVDESGQITAKVGDPIEAFVVSKRGGEILLSYRRTAAMKSAEDLDRAQAQKIPVRGRVAKVTKGGFEVMVLGKTAFCPVSQIDTRFVENGAEHVGKEYEFLVERVEGNGRNIVVSRSALLRQQADLRAKELLATLKPDQIFPGTVTEIRDFGAFVDIGGVEGLVHVSALSHARVAKASDVVSKGDKVQVKVLKIDQDDKGRPKISLSMKAAAQDPWETIRDHVEISKSYTGRVVNLMQFGAFVEIKPGIEGLLHVSEMSWLKRVNHPSDVVKVGDAVTVTVKDIDTVQKRISLSMKQIEDDPWFDAQSKFPVGRELMAAVERLKPFGAIIELTPGLTGLLPMGVIKRKFGEAYRQPCTPGKQLEVKIQSLDLGARKLLLSLVGVEEEDVDQKNYLEYLASEAAPKAAVVDTEKSTGSFGALLKQKLEKR